ncbi:MAG: hypothetical protein U1F52_01880 [Burkholderiales bacterium]
MHRSVFVLLVLLALLTPIETVLGQSPDRQANRERELLRRAQAAQKQAEEARAAMADEKTRLEGQVKALAAKDGEAKGLVARERRRSADLQKVADAATRERDQAAKEKSAFSSRLVQTEAKLAETLAVLARIEGRLAAAEADLTARTASLGRLESGLEVCRQRNGQLGDILTDLMSKYRTIGVWDVLKRREPFTGLEQSRVEALLESVRDRADGARMTGPQ